MNIPEAYAANGRREAGMPWNWAGQQDGAQADRLDIRGVVAIFRRRLWMFLRIVALCLAIAVLITMNMPVSYTATADVELRTLPNSSTSDQTEGRTADDPGGVRTDTVDTEIQVIKSRALAARVFDQLDLEHNGPFMQEALRKSGITAILRRMVFIDPGLKKGSDDPRERRQLALDYMLTMIDATRIVTTAYAVHINYSDSDPARSALIANAYARAYASDQATSKQADNTQAIANLQGKIEQLRVQAEADYAAEQRYRIANNLLSANATSLTEAEVSNYNQQVALAHAEASRDRATYTNAQRQLGERKGAAGEAQVSPVIDSLRSQRAAITTRIADLSSRFLDDYPDLAAAHQQLRDIDAQIDIEVRRTLQMLDARARASEQRLGSLEQSQTSATGKLSRNNGAMIALDGLHRRSESSQATYDTYLNRYKDAVAKSGAEHPDSRTISLARAPHYPGSPNWALNLALALVLGLILGGTAAMLAETNFAGLTSGDDVEQRLGMPYWGGIPLLASVQPHAGTPLDAIAASPGGGFAEAVRGVLAATRQLPGRKQVVAVVSALPDEGKTTLAACMARVAGLAGERVVVIDCDAVRSNLSKLWPGAESGLREILLDGAALEVASNIDPVGNVTVITIAGSFLPSARLNEKGRLLQLINRLRERYDIIVLDLPPILPMAEPRELTALADAVVFVAKWRKSSDQAIRAALKLLPSDTITRVGVTLNAVDMRKRMQVSGAEAFYRQYGAYYKG